MPTRNVVLTEHQAAMIDGLVKSGRYQNASEVLRDGLRLLEQRNSEFDRRLAVLQEAAQIGWADIEAGRSRTFKAWDELNGFFTSLIEEELDPQPE